MAVHRRDVLPPAQEQNVRDMEALQFPSLVNKKLQRIGEAFVIEDDDFLGLGGTQAPGLGVVAERFPLDPCFHGHLIHAEDDLTGQLDIIPVPVDLQHPVPRKTLPARGMRRQNGKPADEDTMEETDTRSFYPHHATAPVRSYTRCYG